MQLQVPLEHGAIFEQTVANPAAGIDFSIALAGNFRYHLLALKFRLATDVNVANRYPDIGGTTVEGGGIFIHSEAVVVASITVDIQWIADFPVHTAVAANRMSLGFGNAQLYNGGGTINSNIRQIQVGDQLSTIVLRYRRWPMQVV